MWRLFCRAREQGSQDGAAAAVLSSPRGRRVGIVVLGGWGICLCHLVVGGGEEGVRMTGLNTLGHSVVWWYSISVKDTLVIEKT